MLIIIQCIMLIAWQKAIIIIIAFIIIIMIIIIAIIIIIIIAILCPVQWPNVRRRGIAACGKYTLICNNKFFPIQVCLGYSI